MIPYCGPWASMRSTSAMTSRHRDADERGAHGPPREQRETALVHPIGREGDIPRHSHQRVGQ